MRAVVFVHRWLGIAGSLLFAAWFVSGIVMMYARMPELSPDERQAHRPPLDLRAVRLSLPDAARAAGVDSPQSVRLEMLLGRPVYRFGSGANQRTIFANTGAALGRLSADDAVAESRRFAREHASTIRYDARLVEPDQWTLQSRAMLPLHRVALGDAADSYLYISERTGEVAVKTTSRERRIAYAGAVLHWIYFTPFRKHGQLWNRTIVVLALAGSVMCLLGLVWGFSLGTASPYRGWMRWHHYAGLAFGLVSFTWVFSGLLSMDPWDWHPSTTPDRAQREAFSGGGLHLDRVDLGNLANLVAPTLKTIDVGQFEGEPFLIFNGRPEGARDRDALIAAARRAVPGPDIVDAVFLDRYDAYYYDRPGGLALPVLRVRFDDADGTWLYIDPRRGEPVRREVRLTRLNRWLYHGLHSFDFPFLYGRRPLWDIVVIFLSLGGIASIVTSAAPAWRRLRRHAHRLL